MIQILLSIGIAISAVIFGMYAGRAQAERLRTFPNTLRAMRVRNWISAFIIVTTVFLVSTALFKHENEAKKSSLREQFRLPSDIILLDFKHGDPTRKRVIFSAKANFDSRQWNDYIGDLDDQTAWQPMPLRRSIPIDLPFTENSLYNKGQPIDGDYSPDAKLWEKLPKPLRAEDLGDMHINDVARLHHVWWGLREAQPTKGRIMCYVFQEWPEKSGGKILQPSRIDLQWNLNDNFKVSPCSKVANSEPYYTYVLGVLDFEERSLYMSVK